MCIIFLLLTFTSHHISPFGRISNSAWSSVNFTFSIFKLRWNSYTILRVDYGSTANLTKRTWDFTLFTNNCLEKTLKQLIKRPLYLLVASALRKISKVLGEGCNFWLDRFQNRPQGCTVDSKLLKKFTNWTSCLVPCTYCTCLLLAEMTVLAKIDNLCSSCKVVRE